MASQEIRVRPLGWQTSPSLERFELSNIDHIVPKVYVHIAEVFRLLGDADHQAIVLNLTKGLEATLGQFPILMGTLHINNERICVIKKKQDASVALWVQHLEDDESFPTFDYLDEQEFPVQLLDPCQLLPERVANKDVYTPPARCEEHEGPVTSAFHINFIRGGLILAAAVHHNIVDAKACNRFLTAWARNSTASKLGAALTSGAETESLVLGRRRLNASKPSASRWSELDGGFPALRSANETPSPTPPPTKSRIWHFPQSRLLELKEAASRKRGGNSASDGVWISTYDAVIGLLWRSITRARIPFVQPDVESRTTSVVELVNIRGKMEPPLADSFIGNAVVMPCTEPWVIGKVVSDNSLPALACAIRQATNSVTPQYITNLTEWVAGVSAQPYIESNINCFLGMDLMASSWQAMSPYEHHDFGFGVPKALRVPNPQIDGYVFVMPGRASVKPEGSDEGIEVVVCLEESCHDRLNMDDELLKFAEPRGFDA